MSGALERIIGSKKVMLSLIPLIVSMVGTFGFDMSLFEGNILDATNAFFGVLVVIQGFLDHRHGSPSDGSEPVE